MDEHSVEGPVTGKLFDRQVAAVRSFNRFYTRQIGLLEERLLRSPFSLTEARIIYELAHHEECTASDLGEALGLDAGYVSRILRGFIERGLIERRTSEIDGRKNLLWLTAQGQEAFAKLDSDSRAEVSAMLTELAEGHRHRLVEAMHTIEDLLGPRRPRDTSYVLRPPQPGDMGWVVYRHGAVYALEYGWDEHFEALVADIVAKFANDHDSKRERCWIAEIDGENVGCVFLVRASPTVAKLRLLLVEPAARGLGIGRRLVDECVRFARRVGYERITLWTNDVLDAARRIYEEVGFALVREESHHSFGHDLTGQTWDLDL